MGVFRKEKNYEETVTSRPGSRGSLAAAKRYVKKLLAFTLMTAVFGIVYSHTTQAILDMAWQGQISWMKAFEESMIKALQYGTLKAPEMAAKGLEALGQARVFTALINYFFPLAAYFMANFYIVSFILDVFDGREGEVFRYWIVFLATFLWIGLVYAVMNGFVFATGAEVTFNQTEIIHNLNQSGAADPIGNATAPTEPTHNATNTTTSAGNQTGGKIGLQHLLSKIIP